MQLELHLVELPHVLVLGHLLQILLQLHQLVVLAAVVRQDRYPVLQLENVGVRCIINQNYA